ncbi:MAG: DUF3352 domain-containing protein [Candidatus Gracilibacteria bacterium]
MAKKTPKKTAEEPKKKDNVQTRQKIRGGILIAIGLGAIIFIAFFLFSKFFQPQPLAEILPAEQTLGFVEVNIDGKSQQVEQFSELLRSHAVYQRGGIIALLNQVFPVSFTNDVEPWLGRQIGLAALTNQEGSMTPLLFIESNDHEATLDFLKARTLDVQNESIVETEHQNGTIYSFEMSQQFAFTFVQHYLLVAPTVEDLQNFYDHYYDQPRLIEHEKYRKVANNLARGGLAFAYIDMEKLFETLEKDKKFVSLKGQELLAFKPYTSLFTAEGLTIFAEKDRFTAQTYTSLNKEALNGEPYVTFEEDYQSELLKYLGEDPIIVIGGHDFTAEWSRIEELFKSGTKTPALLFDGTVEAQKDRFFGKNIGIKEDLYPLLTGEYAFSIENSLEDPQISVLLKLKNADDIPRFERVVNEFINVSGVFSPIVQEVELPDGTIAQEIVASPEQIEESTKNHGQATVTSLRLGNTGIQIHYTIIDNTILASNSEENLQKIIDRVQGTESENLTTTHAYERHIQPIIRNADQVLRVKLGALTERLGLTGNGMLAPYLVPWNNFTMAKNFFEDGVATTYFVEVL